MNIRVALPRPRCPAVVHTRTACAAGRIETEPIWVLKARDHVGALDGLKASLRTVSGNAPRARVVVSSRHSNQKHSRLSHAFSCPFVSLDAPERARSILRMAGLPEALLAFRYKRGDDTAASCLGHRTRRPS